MVSGAPAVGGRTIAPMNPTGCPRCVAERWACRGLSAATAAARVAVPTFFGFALAASTHHADFLAPVSERWVYGLALLAFAFACLSLTASGLARPVPPRLDAAPALLRRPAGDLPRGAGGVPAAPVRVVSTHPVSASSASG